MITNCIACASTYGTEMKNLQEKDAKEKEKQRRATASKNSSSNATGDVAAGAEDGAGAGTGGGPRSTRAQKRKAPSAATTDEHEFAPPDEHDEHEGMDAASIREHEEVTKVKVWDREVTASCICGAMLIDLLACAAECALCGDRTLPHGRVVLLTLPEGVLPRRQHRLCAYSASRGQSQSYQILIR